ncbi:hypothetical protein [Thaumasiovibrio subtropicus]|uniref:hypothetical protein n=1 Tax=Thaumasiovibrio subtropicus TaxID=1891207 RepID=UPI001C85EE88|nr:hypothetical protein [Thaumasiovibrio subtropicus]
MKTMIIIFILSSFGIVNKTYASTDEMVLSVKGIVISEKERKFRLNLDVPVVESEIEHSILNGFGVEWLVEIENGNPFILISIIDNGKEIKTFEYESSWGEERRFIYINSKKTLACICLKWC